MHCILSKRSLPGSCTPVQRPGIPSGNVLVGFPLAAAAFASVARGPPRPFVAVELEGRVRFFSASFAAGTLTHAETPGLRLPRRTAMMMVRRPRSVAEVLAAREGPGNVMVDWSRKKKRDARLVCVNTCSAGCTFFFLGAVHTPSFVSLLFLLLLFSLLQKGQKKPKKPKVLQKRTAVFVFYFCAMVAWACDSRAELPGDSLFNREIGAS